MASWSSIARACSVFAILVAAAGCRGVSSSSSEPLPDYGEVPAFELTAHTGQPFNRSELDGRVWVVDFMFTNCAGPCPRMTAQMKQVQRGTAAGPEVRLVSISIDPQRDTPDVLAAYARKFKADTSRWVFLTGSRETIHHLSRNVFKLGDVNDSLEHSTRFVLVDRRSRIRGFYNSFDADSMSKLIADIQSLTKEQA